MTLYVWIHVYADEEAGGRVEDAKSGEFVRDMSGQAAASGVTSVELRWIRLATATHI